MPNDLPATFTFQHRALRVAGRQPLRVCCDTEDGWLVPAGALLTCPVCPRRFNLEFFSQFDVVLNGLDNLEARRHVNRLCLAAEKPLVESGTAGYLGQVR